MIYVDYKIPSSGLGSDFSQFERPLNYAETYRNRFRNITGGAEKRAGMGKVSQAVPGSPNLTRMHEHVSPVGVATLFTSDDSGNIWKYNASAWDLAYSVPGGANARFISAQAEDKLIFVNGQTRNQYTTDGTTFRELKAIITRGTGAGGTNATTLVDGDISNWIGATLAANNDIVHNVTLDAYGILSTIASANLTHTTIGSAATGAGNATRNQQSGDVYELIDHVDLNIIPQATGINDNTATATSGTTTTVIAVSGVDFSTTEIRKGDFVYNTTRSAIDLIGSVSARVNIQNGIAGQTTGDALAFFKSAMPIASNIHIHYGRVYFEDARDNTRVVITAPDDPEDVTTYQKTLDTTSFSFGTQQPTGDTILAMETFQSYFVAAGRHNIFIYKGNTPIQDVSTTDIDFTPVAAYPDGVVGRFGLAQNGSELLYISDDGLQAVSIGNDSSTTIQNNVSLPIKEELRSLIQAANPDDIQLTFYPRRTWLINKIGDSCYILNNNPTYDDSGRLFVNPAWHKFDGKWGRQNHYFVRRSGDLIACGAGGFVYNMDNGDATDDGDLIPTDLTMAWLRLEEPQKSKRIKQGHYIAPVFESSPDTGYTINVVAGWDNYSSDSITVSAGDNSSGAIGAFTIGTSPIGGGEFTQASKYPLRWRGEQARIQFQNETSASPDIITGFSIYGDIHGVR